jgi:endoglucanase
MNVSSVWPCAVLIAVAGLSEVPKAGASDVDAAHMSFFVTSTGPGDGANLGGLAGADRQCQQLAQAVGAGDRAWRAYLSTSASGAGPAVSARDRIGAGPWTNVRGVVIARDLEQLHSDRNGIDRHTALSETGQPILGRHHDILTGSGPDGRLAPGDADVTCGNWTSNRDGSAMLGHHDRFYSADRFPRWNRSWNAAHVSRGCDPERLRGTGSNGLFYCFAAAARPQVGAQSAPRPAAAVPASYSFKRGVNLAHWLSHNVEPDFPYAGSWFDEEDVAWIAKQGFDHLRLRVGGHDWVKTDGDLDETKLAPFDKALEWARLHRLGVVLTLFSFPGFRDPSAKAGPEGARAAFTDEERLLDAEYLWWLLARRYADEGDSLRFEILHRPAAENAAIMNAFNAQMLAAIRATNPSRWVYLTSHDMSPEAGKGISIPADPHVALAFEFWEPKSFTQQFDAKRPLVAFPAGPAEPENTKPQTDVASALAELAAWARRQAPGREIYVGEFGVYQRADATSTRNYIQTLRSALEKAGISWAIYDYFSGCAIRDEAGRPTVVLEGLSLR